MNQPSTPLNRYGIFRKTGLFLFFGLLAVSTFFAGFLIPLLWIGTLLALGVMGMCLGHVATGHCPVCNEHLEVHKKQGGTQCRGCGVSLMIQDGRLWSLQSSGVNSPAASQSSRGRPTRKPLLTGGCLIGLGICILLIALAWLAGDRPPAGKQPDAAVGSQAQTAPAAGQDAGGGSLEIAEAKPAADRGATIPGLSAAAVCTIFTKQGFDLSTEVLPEQIGAGVRLPGAILWECSQPGKQSTLRSNIHVFGYSDSEIVNVRGMYVGNSSDGRIIRRESRRLLEDVASIEYTGSRPGEAMRWVRENMGQNTKTVIGPVSFELTATSPRTRALVIQPVSEEYASSMSENERADASAAPDMNTLNALAAAKLRLAKILMEKNDAVGKKWLQEVIDEYPETEAAQEASVLLKN